MVNINDYNEIKECSYKYNRYLVRDNGAVMRCPRGDGNILRKLDDVWTFGKANVRTGYMEIAGERVHRIVACAFHGDPPSDKYVVDHIDTNRRNNRPENLRWLTRLENVLKNPITMARIENICGSIENFLANPSVLRGHEHIDYNFTWMRSVSREEAEISLERLSKWAKERPIRKNGILGEWIFHKENKEMLESPHDVLPILKVSKEDILLKKNKNNFSEFSRPSNVLLSTMDNVEDDIPVWKNSLTVNALQRCDWKTPTEFPLCPSSGNDINKYYEKITKGAILSQNIYGSSYVDDVAITSRNEIIVKCKNPESIKEWNLTIITIAENKFAHYFEGTYFVKASANKYFNLLQGKKWNGGEVFDDYC